MSRVCGPYICLNLDFGCADKELMYLRGLGLLTVFLASMLAGFSAPAAEDCPLARSSSLEGQARDLKNVADKAEQKGSCDEFFGRNPEAKEFAAKAPSTLADAVKAAAEDATPQLSCLKGLVKNWKDQATDIYEFLRTAGEERKAFIKSCEEDLTGECRRRLTERARGPDADQRSISELLERADQRDDALRKIKSQQANSKPEGLNLGPAIAAAWDKLKKTGVEIQCYNRAKQTELLCYGIGYVIDPTILVPGAKAVTSAARIRSLAKLKAVAEVETVATKTALEESAEKLGFTPGFSRISNNGKETLGVFDPEARTFIGQAKYYTPRAGENVLDPGTVEVVKGYQGKGVYKAILEQQLKDHPQTTQIKGSLWFDNQDVVEKAIAGGSSCLEAIMLTPAYKVRAGLGFSKIVSYKCGGRPEFVVERP